MLVKELSASFRRAQREVPGMSDEAPAGLEQPLLQARQRPVLDGERQDQPAQQIAKVVGDHPEEQPDLVGSEAVTGEARPVGGDLALLDPLLRRSKIALPPRTLGFRVGKHGLKLPPPEIRVAPLAA